MSRASLGPAVVDGQLRYVSPSSLTTADHESVGGCLRRWWYRYVARIKEPQNKSQAIGDALHKEIETYLKTGRKHLSTLALAGMRYMPQPGPDLLIEHPLDGLTVADIPVIGYIDLVRRGGGPTVANDVDFDDPGDSVEITDWKTTSDIGRNAKTGQELARTIQMVTYAKWAVQRFDVGHVRLSHVYFQTRGRPLVQKHTARVSRDQIAERFERVERVALKVIDAARAPDAESLEGNPDACPVYGGCPRRAECSVGRGGDPFAWITGPKQEEPVNEDIRAKLDALIAHETKASAPPVAKTAVDPKFAEAWTRLEAAKKGTPTLTGRAAVQRALMTGHDLSNEAGLAGTGLLGSIVLDDPAEVIAAADQIAPAGAPKASAPVEAAPATIVDDPADLPALLPPDAPPSKPELAAKPVEGWSPLAPLVVQPEPIVTHPPVVAAEAPKKRGRPRKDETTTTIAVTGQAEASQTEITVKAIGPVEIYVDCLPSTPFRTLDTYVADLCGEICKEYRVPDIRLAPKGTPLEFGGWKGVLAALARSRPPGPGRWVLYSRGEISEIVAEALRPVADLFVTGVRR